MSVLCPESVSCGDEVPLMPLTVIWLVLCALCRTAGAKKGPVPSHAAESPVSLPVRSVAFTEMVRGGLCRDNATILACHRDFDAFVDALFAALRSSSALRGHKLELAAGLASPEGLWLEFGVYKGETINYLADRHRPGLVYGFDSFRGLPETWRPAKGGLRAATQKGSFDLRGRLPRVAANVKLVKGLFNATLPEFLKGLAPGDFVSLLHVDCDLYSSTKTVFRYTVPLLRPGSVVAFDELVNYPQYRLHELKALYEVLCDTGWRVEVLGFPGPRVLMKPRGESWPQSVAVRVCQDEGTRPEGG